jgi:hypothetical protein
LARSGAPGAGYFSWMVQSSTVQLIEEENTEILSRKLMCTVSKNIVTAANMRVEI